MTAPKRDLIRIVAGKWVAGLPGRENEAGPLPRA